MSDAAADHRGLTEAALAAAEPGSPVIAATPSPPGGYVAHEDLATWITSELTPKLSAIIDRQNAFELHLKEQTAALEQRLTDYRGDLQSPPEFGAYVESFNAAQEHHGKEHDRIENWVREDLAELRSSIEALDGKVQELEQRPEPEPQPAPAPATPEDTPA